MIRETQAKVGPEVNLTFAPAWQAQILDAPPLIAPARQFVYPVPVPGEEDALARGAMYAIVRPGEGASPFLATCALGFADVNMPRGIWACPNATELCAVAGGYGYIIDTRQPQRCAQIPFRPVTEIRAIAQHNLLLFAGFHALLALGANGIAWQTRRLTWEGLRISSIEGDTLQGFGWNLMTDREVAFTVDLRTGAHTGGAAPGS